MPPYLLLDKSRNRLEYLLLTNDLRIPIHKYRAIVDDASLTSKTEVVEEGPIVRPDENEDEDEDENENEEKEDNVLVEENMFYGARILPKDLIPLPTQAFVTFIPGRGWVFEKLLNIMQVSLEYYRRLCTQDRDLEIFLEKASLHSDEGYVCVISASHVKAVLVHEDSPDPLVMFFRDEFCCLSWKKEHFRRDFNTFFVAEYSIDTDNIDEEAKTILESPKFKKVERFYSSFRFSYHTGEYRLVFKLDAEDQAAQFKDEIGAKVFDALGFTEFTVASEKFLLSKPLTVERTMKILKTFDHPCTKLKESCVLNVQEPLPKDYGLLDKAMKGQFLDSDRILTPFLEYLKVCANARSTSIKARFLHLTQSTGTGKTMLCLYLLETINNGIYCVFRSDRSSGFPPTNNWTRHLIELFKETTSDSEAVRLCLTFIFAAVSIVRCFSRLPKTNLRQLFVRLDPLFSTQFIKDFEFARSRYKTISAAADEIRAISSDFIGDFFPIVIYEWDKFVCHPRTDPQNRISLYCAFRRALIAIKSQKIVAIFVGTKPPVSDSALNYSIEYSVDNNARPLEGAKLINPYIFVHSFDVFLTGDVDIAHGALFDGKVMNPESLQQIAIKCGRPLWNLYENYDKAFTAAAIKLKADWNLARLSAFVMRTGAPVVPSCQLAHKLVLSEMATLEYIDVEGENCFVSYCPEPVLSNAARLFAGSLVNLETVLKDDFLKYVDKRCLLDSGPASEFVARCIALRAVDRAAESSSYQNGSSHFGSVTTGWLSDRSTDLGMNFPERTQKYPSYVLITLRDFLRNLANLSDEVVKKLNLSVEMLDGLVNVSQFIATKCPFCCDQLTLMHAFIRSVGFSLPTGVKGADLMIPVLRGDNCFSAVMIKVKNLDQLSIPGVGTQSSLEIVQKLTCFYTELDLGQKANLKAVPNNECAKIVFQFADQRSRTSSRTAPALVAILPCPQEIIVKERLSSGVSEKKLTLVEKGDVLWILGLDGFAHLFQSQPGTPDETSISIVDSLNFILSGARDFINRIPEEADLNFTPSQNEREGIRTLLNRNLPLKCTDYLNFQDSSFKEAYPEESAKLTEDVQRYKLSSARQALQFKVGEVEEDNDKKRAGPDEAEGQVASSSKRRK